jgi:hypothetical protein
MNHHPTTNRWNVQRLSKVQRQDIHPGTTNNNNSNQGDDSSDDNDYNNSLPGAYAVSRGGWSAFPISPWEDSIVNNVNIVDSSSASSSSPSSPTRRESMLSNRIVERDEEALTNNNIDNDPLRQQQQLEENLEIPHYYGIEKGQSKYRVGRIAAIIGILVLLLILIIALTLVLTLTLSTPVVTLHINQSSHDGTEQDKTNLLCSLEQNSILLQCNSGVLDIPPCAETIFQELSIMLLNGTNHSNIQHPMYPCDMAHFGLLAVAVAKANDVNKQMDDIQQYWILAIVYFALGGGRQQHWRQDRNWIAGNSPCTGNWYGISCSLVDGTNMVESIDLMYNNIVGTFPIEITALHSLRTLNLNGGDVTGTLPSEIGNMTNLTFLYLEDTNLSGSLPTEIGLCQSLKYLNVLRAEISGLIPTEIGQLSQLGKR